MEKTAKERIKKIAIRIHVLLMEGGVNTVHAVPHVEIPRKQELAQILHQRMAEQIVLEMLQQLVQCRTLVLSMEYGANGALAAVHVEHLKEQEHVKELQMEDWLVMAFKMERHRT